MCVNLIKLAGFRDSVVIPTSVTTQMQKKILFFLCWPSRVNNTTALLNTTTLLNKVLVCNFNFSAINFV